MIKPRAELIKSMQFVRFAGFCISLLLEIYTHLLYTYLWPVIIFLPCGFFLSFFSYHSFFSSPNLSGLSAYLECRPEMCCTRLAGNTGRKKSPFWHHFGTIAQLCQAISSELRQVSTIGKKLVKQQYLLHMS